MKILEYREDMDLRLTVETTTNAAVRESVAEIIREVRTRGDEAVLEYCRKFDGAAPEPLEVTPQMKEAALQAMGDNFVALLTRAAENIRAYHSLQKLTGFELAKPEGPILGQRIEPLARVGLYIPGGTAAYPSTVLMNAIPAKIAGCPEVIMVSPPTDDGAIHPAILAAASAAGVDRIFQVGGAQAIAALAYGTEQIPAVDKITGPGNVYVAEAKRQVFGQVAIDMIAGPSEILIIADEKADPVQAAADLLAQAEHDKNARAMLITDSPALAEAVNQEVERQLALLPRQEIARTSMENNGLILLAKDLEEAARIAGKIAPEHLELFVSEPFALFEKVRCAGSVFLGRYCPEALGDYFAGPNHTLPTGGTARFSSALSVDDFIRKTQYIYYTEDALRAAVPDVSAFARSEGLEGHARSIESRFQKEDRS